jgi:two-component system, chemotaxis family, response regulator Rcp1
MRNGRAGLQGELQPIEILLVEDNPADVRLIREALTTSALWSKLSVVKDGLEALDFIRSAGQFARAIRPDLVLLDLNLPKKDGREVLAEVKQDPDLAPIPVVVLTSSSAEEDVLKAYSLHANCFITKPVDLGEFVNVVKSIEDFWLTVVRLPRRNA